MSALVASTAGRVAVGRMGVAAMSTLVNVGPIPKTMKALCYARPGVVELREKPVPKIGFGEALVKLTTTTICGTDTHILKGEYPVKPGLTVGHEPVGVIAQLGPGVTGYKVGQRVICGAITPCGQCYGCLDPSHNSNSQCGIYNHHGHATPSGGWMLGNTIDGTQAEYFKVPAAQANLTVIPDGLTDEQVLMCPDIMSTGFSGAEGGDIRIGDTVAVFAQGPIGLCAVAGARLMGATRIFAMTDAPGRFDISKKMGADERVGYRKQDAVKKIMELTNGRGVDVAIEALGSQKTFETALRIVKPGGTLSSLGVYSTDLKIPYDAYGAGLSGQRIINQLCPGGKDRMRRLLSVIQSKRVDLSCLVTHKMPFDKILDAYDMFVGKRDGVLKIAIKFD